MALLPRSLIDHLAQHHGIAISAQLDSFGISGPQRRLLLDRGILERVHRGVYRIRSSPLTFEGRCLAACLADDELVISGPSAARLWGFRHRRRIDTVYASVSHDRTPITKGVRLRRTNSLHPADVVTRDDGIRLTSRPRAWFDSARDLSDERFESLTEQLIDDFCGLPALYATGRRLAGRGRNGSARVRRVMSQRPAWQKPADSGLEVKVLRALREHGLRHLVQQHPLELLNGSMIHFDAADPDIKWGLEIDHVTWHGGRFDAQYDKTRDRGARRLGWQVDRVTDQECKTDLAGVARELVELHALRARASGRLSA